MANEPQAAVLVRGPGTSTSDSIPAALSDGEVVIPADDVRRFGAAQLMRMVKEMGGALPDPGVKDGVQHAAAGGMIVDPNAVQPGAVTRVGNSYSGGSVTGNIAVNGAAPGGTVSTADAFRAPPPPATPPVLGAPAAQTPLAPKPMLPVAAVAAPVPAVPGVAPAPAPAAAQPRAGTAPQQQFFSSGALTYAQGGLVDPEDLNRAAFGIYPRPSSQFSTNANDAALQRGVQATGPASFAPAKPLSQAAIAPAPPPRLDATTDPRSTLYAGAAAPAPAIATPEAAPVAPVAPASGMGPLSARGSVTDLGGASAPAVDRTAQLTRDADAQRSLSARALDLAQQGVGGPTPGMGVIGPADYANRNANFNDSAQLRTTLARGAPPGRNGAQVFAQQVEGASLPLVQRAQQDALQTKEQGATQRSMFDQQGLAARAQLQDLRQQESNSIDRAKLGVDVYKSDQAARVAGAKAGLTEDQAKSAGYAVRMENALKLIGGVGATNPGATRPGLGTALVNMLPEPLANKARPEDRQRVEAAQLDALDAALTLNTGAAYTKEQLQGLSRSYFAQPGDADKTVAEKQARLNSLIDTARLRAGPSGGTLADTAVQKATSANARGAQPAGAVPPGMSHQVGTSGGKPVYEDANGRRFIGG